jgi:O-antigen/teichoic acid export membrane protein
MSRFKDRYFATLVSGYALMGMQIIISLATVPLALKYLGKEGFGIWALATQVAIWLQMLDAGMNGALARHLIDYRAEPEGEGLAHCIATGFRVLSSQGLVILLMAILVGCFSGPLIGLSAPDAATFRNLLFMLGAATGFGFVSKIVQSWLYATQRLDACNLIALGLFIVEFTVFWLLLRAGCGIYALAWARMFTAIGGAILSWWTAIRLARFPVRYLKGSWNAAMFHRLAAFGGGMFLLTLGTQLLTATQTALVSKHLGLATAAVWATAPKLFQLILQMVSKLWDFRVPFLSSLMAGDHRPALIIHFNGLFRATAYIGGGGLGAAIAMNPAFLSLWTNHTIQWAHANDLWIALAFYFSLLIRCLTDFVMHTKKIGWMPFLMLCEGGIFVVSASLLLPRFGISGMLLASLVVGGLLRLPYAWRYFRAYLSLNIHQSRALAGHAVGGGALGATVYLLLTLAQHGLQTQSPWLSFAIQGALAALLLGPIAFKLVVSSQQTLRE